MNILYVYYKDYRKMLQPRPMWNLKTIIKHTSVIKQIFKWYLAVRYFSHKRPDTARWKLKFEIFIRPRLRQRFKKLKPNDHNKVYSESEIETIKKYPGVPPLVPVIIILIETCLNFYSVLSSKSAERQLPVCAFQTNPMACDRDRKSVV